MHVIMTHAKLLIENIPAIEWGERSDSVFIAIHGDMSHKADDVIDLFAQEAVQKGYQVLSFDLPEHGDRKAERTLCKIQNCVQDLHTVMRYARPIFKHISLFACSMGAYFSLLSYAQEELKQALFLSPVVNMELVINNMMQGFGISEERLRIEQEIRTPIGKTLYWDYYCYVKEHPIQRWNTPISILCGSQDNINETSVAAMFANQFNCDLHVLNNAEHYFHTKEQLDYFRQWLKEHIV
jgi:alpha-beta hydrolase superfamily lysophospholipase